jgi:hypothetical protein
VARATSDERTLKIVGLANGQPSQYDGQYIVRCEPVGEPGSAVLDTTTDIQKARRFNGIVEATEYWQQADPRMPVRPDGKPNRPLTAFSVEIARVPDAGQPAGRGVRFHWVGDVAPGDSRRYQRNI